MQEISSDTLDQIIFGVKQNGLKITDETVILLAESLKDLQERHKILRGANEHLKAALALAPPTEKGIEQRLDELELP